MHDLLCSIVPRKKTKRIVIIWIFSMIIKLVLEDFDEVPTHRVQLQGGNHSLD